VYFCGMTQKKKFYVVWVGKKPGVYANWDTCRKQVEGFQGARYKSFANQQEALQAFEAGP